MLKVRFEASEALFDNGSAKDGQPDELVFEAHGYVQMTYEGLRVGPDGETLAFVDDGLWYLAKRTPAGGSKWFHVGPDKDGPVFSDVVVWEDED